MSEIGEMTNSVQTVTGKFDARYYALLINYEEPRSDVRKHDGVQPNLVTDAVVDRYTSIGMKNWKQEGDGVSLGHGICRLV